MFVYKGEQQQGQDDQDVGGEHWLLCSDVQWPQVGCIDALDCDIIRKMIILKYEDFLSGVSSVYPAKVVGALRFH